MKPIYLDYQSTTPTDNKVLKKMMPFFSDVYGNPHSSNHSFGASASQAIDLSRKVIASAIGADKSEIIFTSGATESNNLAIKGAFLYRYKYQNRKKIIIAATEHKCVIEASKSLTSLGAEVVIIEVNKEASVPGAILIYPVPKNVTNSKFNFLTIRQYPVFVFHFHS